MALTQLDRDLLEVGEKIRLRRKALNLTQKDLAEMAGMDDKHISRLEMGQSNMKLDTFFSLALLLDVTPNDISPNYFSCTNPIHAESARLTELFCLLPDHQKMIALKTLEALLSAMSQTK